MILLRCSFNSSPILISSSHCAFSCSLCCFNVSRCWLLTLRNVEFFVICVAVISEMRLCRDLRSSVFSFFLVVKAWCYVTSGAGAAIPTVSCFGMRFGVFEKLAIHTCNDLSCCISAILYARGHWCRSYIRWWLCRDINPSIGAVTRTSCVIRAIVVFFAVENFMESLPVHTVLVVMFFVSVKRVCLFVIISGVVESRFGRLTISSVGFLWCVFRWTICLREFWVVGLRQHLNNMGKSRRVSEWIT